ncbi:MAG: glycogen/starch synthase [Deltaproteobacteria bacterium]
MRIVLIASEAAPWAASGGLGEVLGALPAALAAQGLDISLILPLHRGMEEAFAPLEAMALIRVQLHDGVEEATLLRAREEPAGVRVYGIEARPWFDRPSLYGEFGSDYADNARRFTIFSRAALASLAVLGPPPDVIHCHDWQTALIPTYLRGGIAGNDDAARAVAGLASSAVVFTVHNIGYAGSFAASDFPILGLPRELLGPQGLELDGRISLLRGGLIFADHVTTVSPTHARELLTPEGGGVFADVLAARAEPLAGILNGIDPVVWNPAQDAALVAPFDATDLAGKRRCKADLLLEAEIDGDLRTPIVAMVSRLAPQKGFDILLEALPGLLERGVRVIALGQGDERLAANLHREAETGRGLFHFRSEWNDEFGHKILAGADFLLMPSRYEPCGLGQMIAQRYGTIPVVTPVGGLADSVVDPGVSPETATGFWMEAADRRSLALAVSRALDFRSRTELFDDMQRRGMTRDFSWNLPARRYGHLYRRAAERRHRLGRPVPPFLVLADGWRARLGDDLTQDNLDTLARAVADELGRHLPPGASFVVGHDGRFLAPEFASRVAGVLTAQDVRVVVDLDPRPLPVLAYAAGGESSSGGLVVSGGAADHATGGLVLFGDWGGAELADVWAKVVRRACELREYGFAMDRLEAGEAVRVSLQEERDFLPAHRRSLLGILDHDILCARPPRLVVDCRHGAAGATLRPILATLGLEMMLLHDGLDPAEIGKEPFGTAASLADVQAHVRSGFDAGIVISGDGSFARVVDAEAGALAPGLLAALLLDYVCETRPGKIRQIGRSVAASHLVDAIACHHGLGIIEAPNGFAELGRMLGGREVGFAVDERGGLALAEHGAWRDGFLVMLLVAEMMARDGLPLAARVQRLHERMAPRELVHHRRQLDPILVDKIEARVAVEPTQIAALEVRETIDLDGRKYLLEDDSWVVVRLAETRQAVEFWAEAPSAEAASELLVAAESQLFAE